MKIVYDNIIFSLQRVGGISVYWSELIKRLNRKNAEVIFYGNESENVFERQLDIKTRKESSLPIRILMYLPFRKKIPKGSVFHGSYYRVSLQKSVVNVVTVHDFTYEYFRNGLAKYIHHWQKRFALKRANGIICVSENTKRDLLKFFPSLSKKSIKVIYLAASDGFHPIKGEDASVPNSLQGLDQQKYILFVGSRAAYKNFDIAVGTVGALPNYHLVIAGGDELSQQELSLLEKKLGGRYHHLKNFSEKELNWLYNNAFCLLYPSSYEGFGIPVLEAMKAGCPVVSTNTSSIPEVAGDATLLVDVPEVGKFAEKIRSLENESLRKRLTEQGFQQARKFSWDKCFEKTYSFYEQVWTARHEKSPD